MNGRTMGARTAQVRAPRCNLGEIMRNTLEKAFGRLVDVGLIGNLEIGEELSG